MIGDERNDESLLVAQTHLAFLEFHNRFVDWHHAQCPSLRDAEVFADARRLVTWDCQWFALFDFVERLTEKRLIDEIKHDGRSFHRFRSRPYMPAESSAAAYRLGHSMVREGYSGKRVSRPGGLAPASLGLLFFFTGKSAAIIGDLAATANAVDFPGGPGPQTTLPST